jgi:hypothetical protein
VSCVSDKAAPSLKGGVAWNRGSPFLFIDAYATISSCNLLYIYIDISMYISTIMCHGPPITGITDEV